MSQRFFQLRRGGAAGIGAVIVGTSLLTVPQAGADEVDDLIARASELSRQASAANEKVLDTQKHIEDIEKKIADGQGRIDSLKGDVEKSDKVVKEAEAQLKRAESASKDAAKLAEQARAAQDKVQAKVNEIADAQYRGVMVDPLTNAINSKDPQDMIDRAAYMGILERQAADTLESLKAENLRTADQASKAQAAVAEADWTRSELKAKHDELAKKQSDLQKEVDSLNTQLDELHGQQASLDEERASLSSQAEEIQAMIGGFSSDARSRWVNQYGADDTSSEAVAAVAANAQGAVASALSKVGSPYEWGAAGPGAFDCSGLMYWSYAQNGKSIPRTSQAQIAGGTPVSIDNLQPGDIVGFYPGVTHVGMYIGNGQVVHASDYGIPVQVVSLNSMPFAGAARY